MTYAENIDRAWCHALLKYCHIEEINEIVKGVGPPESDGASSTERMGEWCCTAGATLCPQDMGKVMNHILATQHKANFLSEAAIDMLMPAEERTPAKEAVPA